MKIKAIINILFIAFFLSSCVTVITIPSPTPSHYLTNTPTPILIDSGISGEVVYSYIAPNTTAEQIFLKNLDTGYVTQLTSSGDNSYPVWSPDGSKIIYAVWTDEKKYSIYIMNKDGSGKTPVMDTLVNEREADWSADGHEVIFVSDKDGNDEIYKINLDTQVIDRLTFTPYAEAFPHWSPDGNNISFASSNDGGPMHIFVMDSNGKNLRQVTNSHVNDVDAHPIWCPDGACIVFFRLVPSKLLILDLNTAEISPLLGDIFKSQDETAINMEGFPSRSPVRGYITFAMFGQF